MGRGDWHRRTEWSDEIEADFDAHLRRARDKVQPLKVQAAVLAETHPDVALRLIDRYFESGDHIYVSEAHQVRAEAYVALGDVPRAIEAYRACLAREAEFSGTITTSSLTFPLLIAERRLEAHYDEALYVLEAAKALYGGAIHLAFPIQRFEWHAARALILDDLGRRDEARAEARAALAEAGRESSGFSRHKSFGLVGDSHGALQERLTKLSSENERGSLLWKIWRRDAEQRRARRH